MTMDTRQARRDILTMSFYAQVGHIPSALSMVDYLAVAFSGYVDPRRDRVVLGKPYGAQAYYALFAQQQWITPNWRRYGSSDPNWRYCIGREHPLVTFIDDTLGNTLSVACGIALAFPGLVYVNASDAYFQAGSVWEAVMFAGMRKQSNLVMTIDNNHMQVLGRTPEILDVEPLAQRLALFGWRTFEADGHDAEGIKAVFDEAFAPSSHPTAVVLRTVKGQGVSFMRDDPDWHYELLSLELYEKALSELL